MTLEVKPNTHDDYPHHKYNILADGVRVAYSNRLLTAHLAKAEIQKNVIKAQSKRMTQQQIDERPADQELQGTMRRLIWKAVHAGLPR
jgi:hypothetical protein